MKLREAPIKETGRTPVKSRRQHQRRVTQRQKPDVHHRKRRRGCRRQSRQTTKRRRVSRSRDRQENPKPVERRRKQTGEKEKVHLISISVKDDSERTEKREKLFSCMIYQKKYQGTNKISQNMEFMFRFCFNLFWINRVLEKIKTAWVSHIKYRII